MGSSVALRSAHRLAVAGIGVNVFLSAINIVFGILSQSMSAVAVGLEFAGDVLASSIVLVGVRVAALPPDANHPYGHGRVETLAAFIVGLILAGGGVTIAVQSLRAIGAVHDPPGYGALWALGAAVVIRAGMSVVKFRTGRQTGSSALIADAWNDTVDIVSALGAMIAVSLANYDPSRFLAADHYGGFLIGVIVVIMGTRVMRDATLELMDTMPAQELTETIARTALEVEGVIGVEKRFARKTGLQYHVDLHIEVDPAMTVAASHDVATAVRLRVKRELPWVADVLVHVEPAGLGKDGD